MATLITVYNPTASPQMCDRVGHIVGAAERRPDVDKNDPICAKALAAGRLIDVTADSTAPTIAAPSTTKES